MNRSVQAAENFTGHDETINGVREYGQGIIHDTYLVTIAGGENRFILQRINTQVFKKPEAVMHNLHLVCNHMRKRMQAGNSAVDPDWQMLRNLPARDGREFFVDADGVFWRALSFIRGASPLEQVSSLDNAREVGRAVGIFHWLSSDLAPASLQITLPGFHNVEFYLEHYDAVAARRKGDGEAERFCRQFIEARRQWAPVLENGRRENKLKMRVIHGDPKINNIMVSRSTGKAVSIIDMDTVMPGLVQYDIGDCLRSCCNREGEEAADLAAVRFDLNRCEAVLHGYTGAARRFLTGVDFDFFFDAVRLLPFELGLRFYTDFLEGNVYFKVGSREQNLARAMVQFKLVESIEQQEDGIREIIAGCRDLVSNCDSHNAKES